MRWLRLAAPLALVGLAAGLLLSEGGRGAGPPAPAAPAAEWSGLVGGAPSDAAVGQRVLVVLKAPSLAQRVAAAGGVASDSQERSWTAAVFAAQQQLIIRFAQRGVPIHRTYRYARVIDGFSAVLDAKAAALLERAPEGR